MNSIQTFLQRRWLELLLLCVAIVPLSAWVFAGPQTLRSDESVTALMAVHMLEGEWTTYFWGQQYAGSTVGVAAAPFLALFGKWNLAAFRMSEAVLLLLFFVSQILLIEKLWGRKTMLMSMPLLVFPTRFLYIYPNTLGITATLGSLALYLSLSHTEGSTAKQYIRYGIIGILCGLGLWYTQIFRLFFPLIALFFVLESSAWENLRKRILQYCGKKNTCIAAWFISAVCILLGLAYGLQYATEISETLVTVSGIYLSFVAILIGYFLLHIVPLRHTLISGACIAVGFCIGNAPEILAPGVSWEMIPFKELEWANLKTVFVDVVPQFWNMPGKSALVETLRTAVPVVCYVFIVAFIWKERRTLLSMIRFERLSREQSRVLLYLLWFTLPIVALAMRGIGGEAHIRYIFVIWPAMIVLFVEGLRYALRNYQSVCYGILAVMVVYVGGSSLAYAHKYSQGKPVLLKEESVTDLRAYLDEHEITGVYSNYWDAYPLVYIYKEEILFAPYKGSKRSQEYEDYLASLDAFAVLLETNPKKIPTMDSLQDLIDYAHERKMRRRFRQKIALAEVREKKKIGKWQVWIIDALDSTVPSI